jgi:hypothetical protein
MPEPRPDPMTELVRILREQLDHKDDRITALEKQLEEANHRIDEQQRLMVRLLERSFDRSWAPSEGVTTSLTVQPAVIVDFPHGGEADHHVPEGTSGQAHVAAHECPSEAAELSYAPSAADDVAVGDAVEACPPTDIIAPNATEDEVEQPVVTTQRSSEAEHVALPDLGPQISVIAEAVVAAAGKKPVFHEAAGPRATMSATPAASERKALSGSLNDHVAIKDDYEITLRLDRQKLRKGHRAIDRAKRTFLSWRRNREA